jgi:hypothetical protein
MGCIVHFGPGPLLHPGLDPAWQCCPRLDLARQQRPGPTAITRPRSSPVASFRITSGPDLLRPTLFDMVTPPAVDVVTVASAAAGVASAALVAAISTLQAAPSTSCEHVVGAVAAAGAPAGTVAGARPHPMAGPPFVVAGASASAGTVVGSAGPCSTAAIVGAPAAPSRAPGPPQAPPLVPPPGCPSTRPWAEPRTG